MTPGLRKLALTAHVASSVGWLGAVAGFLALAIAGLTSQDAQIVRAAYLGMELIGWFVIVPCCLAALLTGLVQSLGTEWGLFRHYWILVKFLLTVGASILLLLHMEPARRMSRAAAETTLSSADLRPLRVQLVADAGLAALVLLGITTLSIYKPWGRTPYGQRKERERRNDGGKELRRESVTTAWEINGCPVDGPAIAASARQVAAAWFTMAGGKPRASIAFSADSGATFGTPVGVDDGRPLGRVDVIFLDAGAALVSWLEQTEKGAEVRARRIRVDGARDTTLTVADSSSARSSGFPRMAASQGEVTIAWRDSAEPPRVRTAVITHRVEGR